MIKAFESEYRNKFTEDDYIAALVSTMGPQYGATILNNMERLKSAEGEEVTCDALVEKCKLWKFSESGKGIVEDPTETKLADHGYFANNKACFYCKEKRHLRFECPKLAGQ